MKKLILCILFSVNFLGLCAQDIIYTVSGKYDQSKIPLDSILVENVTNGKILSFRNLPDGDNYLLNLTNNTFGGTVDVYDVKKAGPLLVIGNLPGSLQLLYNGSEIIFARLSIININGQVLYSTSKQKLLPGNSIHVELGQDGIYFVRIESPVFTKTFKSVGLRTSANFKIEFADNLRMSNSEHVSQKRAEIFGEGNFSFEVGDSLRIYAYAKNSDVFAWPVMFRINKSDKVDFIFSNIYYPTKMEMAYPDSIGESVPFLFEDDTMYCRKINNEYIFQGDIILSEAQSSSDSLKGAYMKPGLKILPRMIIGKIWPDAKIYYTIDKSLENDERVKNAIVYWNENSPVQFVKTEQFDRNYVMFMWDHNNPSKTSSQIGMHPLIGLISKAQYITIGDNKHEYGIGAVLHEMGHTAGLIHEHSRSDRDQWVKVNKDCYDKYLTKIDYAKFSASKNVGDFDFESIMLYNTSTNNDKGCPDITISNCQVKPDEDCYLEPQRSYLSYGDIKTLEEMYGLSSSLKPTVDVECNYESLPWTITGRIEDQGDGVIIERAIAWKKVGDKDYNYKTFGAGTDDFSYTIEENLTCGQYFCFAKATNDKGSSTSKIVSQYIPPDVSVNISEISTNTAQITIEADAEDVAFIDLINWALFTSKEDAEKGLPTSIYSSSIQFSFKPNPFTAQITGLKPGTTYYARVVLTPEYTFTGEWDDDIVPFTTISSPITDTFFDARGKGRTYKYVQMGTQFWMAENLAYLPAVNPPDVNSLKDPCYYVYDYSGTDVEAAKLTSNYRTYGVLYNWAAALAGSSPSNDVPSGVKGICPDGWHLPSEAEWEILEKYLMDNQYYFGYRIVDIAKSLAANENWKTYPIEGNPGNDMSSNNKSGFSALPAGIKSYSKFLALGEKGCWWTSNGSISHDGYPSLGHSINISYNEPFLHSSPESSSTGYCIRCVKD